MLVNQGKSQEQIRTRRMGKSLNRTFAERGLSTFWEVPGGVLVIIKGKAKQ